MSAALSQARARLVPFFVTLFAVTAGGGCAWLDLPRALDRGLVLDLPTARPPAVAPDSLAVVVWNIEYGERVDRALEEIAADPKLRDADLYLLQEVDEEDTRRMAAHLERNAAWYAASVRPRSGRVLGNAVLSRWPLLDARRVALPHGGGLRGSPRAATVVDLRVGPTRVRAVSAHTSTFFVSPEHRLEQARVVREATLHGYDGPALVGADFNTLQEGDEAALRRLFRAAGFRTPYLGPAGTIETRWKRWALPHDRLDHFFLRRGDVLRAGVVEGTRASDHRPLWIRLRLHGPEGEDPPSTNESGSSRGTDPEGS